MASIRLSFILSVIFLSGCATWEAPSDQAENGQQDPTQNSTKIEEKVKQAWKDTSIASAAAHFSLAEANALDGKTDLAIEEYKAALIYDPNSSVIHTKLSAEYAKKGSMGSAIDEGKTAIELDPKNVDAHMLLAGIYSISQAPEEAVTHYEVVMSLDPTNEEAAVFLVQSLLDLGKDAIALKKAAQFAKQIPDSAPIWYMVGVTEQLASHATASITGYRKALGLRPGFSKAALSLGMIFESTGQTDKALDVYKEAFDAKEDMQVGTRLSQNYLQKGNWVDALKVLESMRFLDPDDLNVPIKIGLVHLEQKEWDKAIAVFSTVVQKVPDSDKVNYYIAAAYEEKQDLSSAVTHLKKVAPDSKYFEDAILHAVVLSKKMGQSADAMQYLQTVITQAPEHPNLYALLASMQEDQSALEPAVSTVESGLKLFPDDQKLLYYYGTLLDKKGDTESALKQMEKLLAINPEHPEAMNFIGYTWTVQGVHLKEAETLLRKALKARPDNPYILDSLGWNLFRNGRHQEALPFLEKAASLKGDEKTILEHLAQVYSRNRLNNRAQATLKQIELRDSMAQEQAIQAAAAQAALAERGDEHAASTPSPAAKDDGKRAPASVVAPDADIEVDP